MWNGWRATIMILALAAAPALAQTRPMNPTIDDPYIWLEDKDGAKSLGWVEAENARTLPRLQGDPRYAIFHAEALAIAAAQDRIPMPDQVGGRILNFWRDAAHPRGLWRATSPADYATPSPHWAILLDVDALGKAEGKEWVFKGATCLQPDERRCLVMLSEGGEDATTVREFDLDAARFVEGGFALPKSKQTVAWRDADTILVARDWGSGTLTASGYPFVIKSLERGAPLAAAAEVFRGGHDDQGSSGASSFHDGGGGRATILYRYRTFFGSDKLLLTAGGVHPLAVPAKAEPSGLVAGQLIFRTSEDWPIAGGPSIPAGAVVALSLADLEAGRSPTPHVVFQPGPRQSVEQVATTRDRLLVAVTDNVRGRLIAFTPGKAGWTSAAVALPDNASVAVASSQTRDDRAFVTVTGFLQPTTLWSLDLANGAPAAPLKATPARFDASRHIVEQFTATSSDGAKIPYFIVHPKDAPSDGSTPTIMTAYGGFEISLTPAYSGITGKLWLERGGSFVVANIRGGGEFGPAWHEAGRKTKRQLIYDDFAAVARDLFARGLTSPAKLGIYGGSNGGLLMGVEFTQHPELWGAVTIQVPLLDMLRYEQIAAGASWVDEYGSVSVAAERDFLARISPYANLRRGGHYPEPYIWTTTKDDRVGPQHARKFAARMKEYGLPYLFYEDTAGGHGGDADIGQLARLQALQMTYFAQKLLPPAR